MKLDTYLKVSICTKNMKFQGVWSKKIPIKILIKIEEKNVKNSFLSPNFDLARADLKNPFQISTMGSLGSQCIGALI